MIFLFLYDFWCWYLCYVYLLIFYIFYICWYLYYVYIFIFIFFAILCSCAQTLLIYWIVSQSTIVRLFSCYTEQNVNEWERFSAYFVLHRTKCKSIHSMYHEKSRKIALWDTIHRWIAFVRMSTIWRDIALCDPACLCDAVWSRPGLVSPKSTETLLFCTETVLPGVYFDWRLFCLETDLPGNCFADCLLTHCFGF